MKYGVYWSVVRAIRFGDRRGINYLSENWMYFIYMGLVIVLFLIDITLIGQLMNNQIFNRPLFLLLLSPLAWGAVFIYFNYTAKKLKE